MGALCCVDRDKPPEDAPPAAPPSEGFLTRKPKATIKKTVLMISSDTRLLNELMAMLSRTFQVSHNDQVATLLFEDWAFDILRVVSTDSIRLATSANLAKVVLVFFDLQDARSLKSAQESISTFRTFTRKDSVRYLVGFNSSRTSRLSTEAADAAANLQCIYTEIQFPRESAQQLVEKMIG